MRSVRHRTRAERADRASNIEKSYAHGTTPELRLRRINADIKEASSSRSWGRRAPAVHVLHNHRNARQRMDRRVLSSSAGAQARRQGPREDAQAVHRFVFQSTTYDT